MKTDILIQLNSHKDVLPKIKELDTKFRKEFGRAPKSRLVYSESGSKNKPIYTVALWHEKEDIKELEWFKINCQ